MNGNKEFPVDDREWDSQERGLRAARDRGMDAMDPTAESYRRVARAVLNAPRCEPPADFAAGIVARIAVQDAGIERALFRCLLLVLATSSAVVAALYGGQWWQAMQGMFSGGALRWVLAGAACTALSWMIGRLHQPADHAGC